MKSSHVFRFNHFIFSTLIVLSFYCNPVFLPEEAMIDWIKTFNIDWGSLCLNETFDHGYIVMGNTSWTDKTVLIKTDQQGEEIWRKIVGKSYLLSDSSVSGSVYGSGTYMQHTKDRGFVIVSNSNSNGAFLIKTDFHGNEVWAKSIGLEVYVRSCIQISGGGYVVSGSKDNDIYLLKTDSNGNKIWDKLYGNNEDNEGGHTVQQTSDSGYIISGYSKSPSPAKDIYIIKTDLMGNLIFDKTIDNSPSNEGWRSHDICQSTDGGYMVFSSPTYEENYSRDFHLFKLDSEGNISWSKTYGDSDKDEYGCNIIQTSDGCFLLVGCVDWMLLLLKIDSNGNVLWEKRVFADERVFGAGLYPSSVIESQNGGYVIGGFVEVFDDHTDMFLIKIGE